MGWEAAGNGAQPLPTISADLLPEPGRATGTRELSGPVFHPIIRPAQFNHALGNRKCLSLLQRPCQWRACLGHDREVLLQQQRAALPKPHFIAKACGGETPKTEFPQRTYSVGRLSLRRVRKKTSYQPTVRNMLSFLALRLGHVFISYRALLSSARTPIVATVRGSTEQQEVS